MLLLAAATALSAQEPKKPLPAPQSKSAADAATANTLAIENASHAAQTAAEIASVQAAQSNALLLSEEEHADSNYRSTVAVQLTTVVLFALGFLGTWLKADRDRRWAKADALEKEQIANEQTAKLNQIHTLVNSNMTASMTGELSALQANVLLLEAHPDITPAGEAALGAKKARVAELEAQLADRKQATSLANAQLVQDEKGEAK